MSKKENNKKGRKNKTSTLQKSGKHEKYNIDNEIVIGLNTKNIKIEEPKINQKKKGMNSTQKFVKNMCIILLIIIAILLFFMSPLFNLQEIKISGNSKITLSECIELSKLQIGQNIYKMNKKQIKDNIRKNAYVENVYVSRKLPSIIEITVEERQATYMLDLGTNEYAYINNQGYILEKSYNKIDTIILTGFLTNIENITVGNRLCEADLLRLETVLKIVESAGHNGVLEYITKINIKDKSDYTLILEEEKKVVYLGDASNISTRMLYLKTILEKEKGIEGEIFVNRNINIDNAYFREKV